MDDGKFNDPSPWATYMSKENWSLILFAIFCGIALGLWL